MTPVEAAHVVAPDSKPGLTSFWPEQVPPPPVPEIVHENVAEPVALVVSFAVTVELTVPAVVGVPEIRPVDALIESPAGRPVAEYVRVWPEAESLAVIWRLLA